MTKPEKLTWILFAIVIILLYLFALDVPLLGPDEPRYAQVAREMFERGDWITPTLGGVNWFEKPALLYWLQITFYNVFGVSEFSARLGSALFGLGTVFCLWVLGNSIRGSRLKFHGSNPGEPEPDPNFANWLGLIAASSIGVIAFSRGASFDIILTFPITAALVSFFIWESKASNQPNTSFSFGLPLFYFFIGVALIAKGLIGFIFPIAIVAFYYLLTWKIPGKKLFASLIWGTILSVLVASVWYLPMYLNHGWEFVDEFFIKHHFQRFSSNKYLHPQPFWFFWIVLPLMTIPWIPFYFWSIWGLIKTLFSRKGAKPQSREELQAANNKLRRLAIAWLLVPLVFFSLSGSKLPGYILPSLPAACILTAESVYRFVGNNRLRRFGIQAIAFLMFATIALLLQFALPKFAVDDSVKGLLHEANSQGYRDEKVLGVLTISHSAEFYAAERLVRTTGGKQRRFETVREVNKFIRAEDIGRALVLVPIQFSNSFEQSDSLVAKPIGKNKHIALIAVRSK